MMDYQKIFELYEKLYFHEVEAREKISARLQIPLAILLSITSVYAYMAKGISLENSSVWNIGFGVSVFISMVLHIISIVYFVRVFYGHTYEFIPSASDTEGYRKQLIDTYKDYDDSESLVSKYFHEYLFKYYNECSSANTSVNDKRSEYLHKCNTFSILNVLPLAIAFLIFTLSGIDKNSIDKEYKVNLITPITLDRNQAPIEVRGDLNTTTLEIDFSDEIKEVIRERQTKAIAPAAARTTTKEDSKRGHQNPKQAESTPEEMR